MSKKIKHAIVYVILIVVICLLFIALFDWIVGPLIVLGVTLGLANSLIYLCLLIGLVIITWFIGLAVEKLIDWLLKE